MPFVMRGVGLVVTEVLYKRMIVSLLARLLRFKRAWVVSLFDMTEVLSWKVRIRAMQVAR